MRTLLISIILLIASHQVLAGNRVYKKLDKLYRTDRSLCLEKAKKYMDRFRKNSIPYYFASTIYYDQSTESTTLRGMYLHMNRSLNSARKFELLSTEEDQQLVHWDEHIAALKNRATRLIEKLDKEYESDLSAKLRSNVLKVPSLHDDVLPEVPQAVAATVVTKTFENTAKISGQFYGLPDGSEAFPAQSAEKERQLLDLINAERLKKGLPPLAWNEDLARASRYHAFDLGSQAYFDHSSYDRYGDELVKVGGTFERINRFYKATAVNTENIAAGNESASATYKQWYNSKGHYDNMFNPDSRFVGIGMYYTPDSPYGYYWVMTTAR